VRTALEVLQEQRGAPQYSPKEYRALEAPDIGRYREI